MSVKELLIENSRLATIASDHLDKTLLRAMIAKAWNEGYHANIGPKTPSWIMKCWLESKSYAALTAPGQPP